MSPVPPLPVPADPTVGTAGMSDCWMVNSPIVPPLDTWTLEMSHCWTVGHSERLTVRCGTCRMSD